MLKEIGFDAISPEWESLEKLAEIAKEANDNGLMIASLHAPYGKVADMWGDNEEKAGSAVASLMESLEACRQFCIPIMVVHTWIGFDYTFKKSEQGLKNYAKIVEAAEAYGVKIAFENTEGEEYLYTLMEYFKGNDTVCFCWDSGHEMCYNHSVDLLGKYGDRLGFTHLNDNLGISRYNGRIYWTDDLHLLPYDGVADWNYNIERLKKAKPLEILNFELRIVSKPKRHENDGYEKMELQLFFTEVYKRACRIAYQYSAISTHRDI